jgi:hypothetical protein
MFTEKRPFVMSRITQYGNWLQAGLQTTMFKSAVTPARLLSNGYRVEFIHKV